MIPSLVDADDDWQEGFRRFWYPRLHHVLALFGGYGTGHVGKAQYVGLLRADEELIEEEMVRAGARRNPLAAYKRLSDGRLSEGSWVFLSDDDPSGRVEEGMQLHITLFERADGEPGREVYAHYEDDWRDSPSAHLRGENMSATAGVSMAVEVFFDYTRLGVYRKFV